uniref:Uncharacterized protein n=1 Tax=Fagus sylvatica TaxID=28930 RepID=A0A2N9E6U0_FAGSY
MKNSKKAVAELTRDRKEALLELEKVKAGLKMRDGDVKVAVDTKDKAVADLQHLAFKKQAVERFPNLDFSAFQPYDDEDSVVDSGQDDQARG